MLNQTQVIGHLGRDPEVRYSPGGDAIASFSVAATEKWKDKASGETQEHTEWFRCVAYGRLGEVCGEYLKKGAQVFVQGKLRTRAYQGRDGEERKTTELIVGDMKMLGGRGDRQAGGDAPAERQAAKPAAAPKPAPAPAPAKTGQGGFDDFEDSIPF